MAQSGLFDTSQSYMKYYIQVDIQDYNVAGNYTPVRTRVFVRKTVDGYGATYGTGTVNVVINGVNFSSSITTNQRFNYGTDYVVFDRTVNIPHNTDGTKTLRVTASINHSRFSGGPNSTDFALPTIPRGSKPTVPSRFTIGDSLRVSIDRASTSFTHTVLITTMDYVELERITSVGAGITVDFSSNSINILRDLTKDSNSVRLRVRVWTVDGSGNVLPGHQETTTLAEVGSNMRPVIGALDLSEAISNVSLVTNSYVAGLSQVRIKVPSIAAQGGATITRVTISSPGWFSVNSRDYTTPVIPTAKRHIITVTAYDSRGNSTSRATSITAISYSPPKITAFDVARVNTNGVEDLLGTRAALTIRASTESLGGGNHLTWRVLYKRATQSTWTTMTTRSTTSTSINTVYRPTTYFAITETVDFQLQIMDEFNTTYSVTLMGTGGTTMSWARNSVGIGKVWERGTLDVDGNIFTSNDGNFLTNRSTDYSGNGKISWQDNRGYEEASIGKNGGDLEIDGGSSIRMRALGTSVTFANGIIQPLQTSTLSMMNGWARRSDFADVRAVKTADGVVHLQGVLNAGNRSAGTRIFRLPVGMRPPGTIIVMAWHTDNTVRRYDIDSWGYMEVYDNGGFVIPLDGISFYAGG